jgi:hypothetical protein
MEVMPGFYTNREGRRGSGKGSGGDGLAIHGRRGTRVLVGAIKGEKRQGGEGDMVVETYFL